MARSKARLKIEVAYASSEEQALLVLEAAEGATAGEAIEQSGIRKRYPHMDMSRCKVGIFGRLVSLDTVLRDGDRVEIYRPLIAEPGDARRQRARREK